MLTHVRQVVVVLVAMQVRVYFVPLHTCKIHKKFMLYGNLHSCPNQPVIKILVHQANIQLTSDHNWIIDELFPLKSFRSQGHLSKGVPFSLYLKLWMGTMPSRLLYYPTVHPSLGKPPSPNCSLRFCLGPWPQLAIPRFPLGTLQWDQSLCHGIHPIRNFTIYH